MESLEKQVRNHWAAEESMDVYDLHGAEWARPDAAKTKFGRGPTVLLHIPLI